VGYDGIEIHAAHGFLLSQFMTPYYNRRNDLYGGSTQNRARMVLETYEEIRKLVGNDYPIWIKINVTDGITDGVSFNDVLYLSWIRIRILLILYNIRSYVRIRFTH
jgi:2,4-dienoyl-CoA reductase-like NADH-dependent reductase (Old Yellow Enzyme family)